MVSAIAFLTAQIAPAWAQMPSDASPSSSPGSFSRSEYEACQTKDEAEFRKSIRSITFSALSRGTAALDYDAIVTDQWRANGLDAIVDKRVDIAIEQIRDETAWSELLKSLAYRKDAQELAKATAERVYRSDEMKSALDRLATDVGKEIGRAIVITTADAAAPAQRCLQAYLGPRYGMTVARSVNRDAGAAFEIDPGTNQADVSTSSVLIETSAGITGAILLLVRRQMARMAQRIGQRIIGSVLGRLVSVVAGGVGIVLIAKEFWELRNGILPIIANEMKSSQSKEKVREELAKSIRDQITDHLDDLSARTADKIVDIWHEFRRAHAKVLQLAERDKAFKTFLDTAHPRQLPRLDELVAIILDKDGPGAVERRLADGSLHVALNNMPEHGMQIAREQRSLAPALAWTSLAGEQLAEVLSFDLHKRADPASFSKATLSRVLALDDRLAVSRIAGLPPEARDILLELQPDKLVEMARVLTSDELRSLAGYLTRLTPDARQRIERMVAAEPARMRLLASPRIRDAILGSRDQAAAVAMMLSNVSPLDFMTVYRHAELVWEGEINPVLIWDRHPGVVVVAVFLLIVLFAMLRYILFGGRRRARSKAASA